jgi:hypothetical protein
MEGAGGEEEAGRLDRRKVAARLHAAQLVDGGAEGVAGGEAGEEYGGSACAAEGHDGRVSRCFLRKPMEYTGHLVHFGSGVPVDTRFLWRGRISDAWVPDTELVAAVR